MDEQSILDRRASPLASVVLEQRSRREVVTALVILLFVRRHFPNDRKNTLYETRGRLDEDGVHRYTIPRREIKLVVTPERQQVVSSIGVLCRNMVGGALGDELSHNRVGNKREYSQATGLVIAIAMLLHEREIQKLGRLEDFQVRRRLASVLVSYAVVRIHADISKIVLTRAAQQVHSCALQMKNQDASRKCELVNAWKDWWGTGM